MKRPRGIRAALLALALLAGVMLGPPRAAAQGAAAAGQRHEVAVENGVRVKMRDGVTLAADVYRPKGEGKYPVLVERTPYNRKGDFAMAHELASHGYVIVLQDTRGRFDSGGEFYPFMHEAEDGYDTVEWAAALPQSDGRVGMFGGSYVGATQMLAATAAPPHLAAIFPYVTASEYYDGWTYQSGALMQWFASSWTTGLTVDTLRRKAAERSRPKEWVSQLPAESYKLLDPPPVKELAPYFADWLRHERSDDYWRRWKVSDHYPRMNVKALHAGGWNDLFVKGSIKNYTGLRAAGPAAVREGQRLLIGPWAHAATSPEGKIGDVVYGKAAVLNMTETARKWFDFALKGVQNEYAAEPPVRIFIMGENVWRSEREFPLARTRYTKYFLHSARGAGGVRGDGRLDLSPPAGERPDSFTYDPLNPVPTVGGRLCCGDALPPGPFDQRPNESREDVLVFSTPPLEADVEVTGYVTAELYAATSAPDTDFTMMLVDVSPDGYARYLTDGIVRARYRETTDRAEPITPGRVYKYDLDLWVTSNLFKARHRIRLYVSSSNFPRFSRNPNTGEPSATAARFVKAGQTIYHDASRPSSVTLPVIPR
ncbi:MAG TPA: CocE/NonD family hydrolase [Pyrinomonadaceae bacterium]|nr:CocE/NonD family hydrolase [Pyrinomonadaceae bacterium]